MPAASLRLTRCALGTGGVTVNGALNLTATSASAVNYTGLASSLSGTGTVNVTPSGAGTSSVTLNGNNSGFTGVLNIGVGALAGDGKVQVNGVLGSAATVNVLSNGTSLSRDRRSTRVLPSCSTAATPANHSANSASTAARHGPARSHLRETMTGTGDGTIGSSTGLGTISGSIGETGGPRVLSKVGAGTIVLSNSNSYSGGTALNDGFLTASNNSALGTGTVTIITGSERLTVTDGITIANNITINGGGVSSRGLIENSGAGNATVSGTITINNSVFAGGHFASTGGGTLTVLGPIISSTTNVVSRIGTVIFSGGGSYSSLSVAEGTLRLGGTNGLSTSATVDVGTSATAIFDLAGYDQTLVGIKRSVGNSATIGNSSTTTDSLLTLTGSSTYAGTITNAVSGGTMKTALAINSGATLTFTGGYTADTPTVSGTLCQRGRRG